MLKGEKVALNILSPDRVSQNYITWMSDPEVVAYLESRFFPQDRRSIEKYVSESSERGYWLWGIYEYQNPDEKGKIAYPTLTSHVGNIRLSVNQIHRFGEVGLVIGKPWWGKGYATESITLVTNFAFKVLGLNKTWAGCYSENPGSQMAFIKAGYEQEAVLKRQYWAGDKYVDDVIYARWATPLIKP